MIQHNFYQHSQFLNQNSISFVSIPFTSQNANNIAQYQVLKLKSIVRSHLQIGFNSPLLVNQITSHNLYSLNTFLQNTMKQISFLNPCHKNIILTPKTKCTCHNTSKPHNKIQNKILENINSAWDLHTMDK